MILNTEFFKLLVIELSSIVHDEVTWYFEPDEDNVAHKGLDFPRSDSGQCFYFYPFSEVVNATIIHL